MEAVVLDLAFEMALLKCPLETGKNGILMKRFDKIVVGTGAHGLHTDIDVVDTCGDQEGNVRKGMANVREELEATDAGHLEIRNDGVKALALQSHEGLFACSGRGTAECGWGKHKSEKFAGGALVVDSEDPDDRGMLRPDRFRVGLVSSRKRSVSSGHGKSPRERLV